MSPFWAGFTKNLSPSQLNWVSPWGLDITFIPYTVGWALMMLFLVTIWCCLPACAWGRWLWSYIFSQFYFFLIFAHLWWLMGFWDLGSYFGLLGFRFSVDWVWGLWCEAFQVFWVGALYINIKEQALKKWCKYDIHWLCPPSTTCSIDLYRWPFLSLYKQRVVFVHRSIDVYSGSSQAQWQTTTDFIGDNKNKVYIRAGRFWENRPRFGLAYKYSIYYKFSILRIEQSLPWEYNVGTQFLFLE